MRALISLIIFWVACAGNAADVFAQTEPERTQISSSVSYIEPDGLRKPLKPDELPVYYAPAFRAIEEPKNFAKIWKPRLTDKKTAKIFAKKSYSKFKDLLELEIDGKKVPMVITYLKSKSKGPYAKSGHIYKALFEAENSIIVIATIFDDAPITREEVLEAFKTIRIDVKNPIDNFDGAPLKVELAPPFEFVFSDVNNIFVKSYPEIDESYSLPSISAGFDDLYIHAGDPPVDTLKKAAGQLFPVDAANFYLDKEPDYSKLEIVSKGYVNIGPERAYRIEAVYKSRMCIQYVWDIQGKSEFDDYLFLFAMGDKEHLAPVKDSVEKIAGSLVLKSPG